MESIIIQRIRLLLEARNESVNAFAASISMKQTTVNNYFLGKRAPSFELIDSILKYIPEVSAEWLLRGTGSMYLSTNDLSVPHDTDSEIIALRSELNGVYKTLQLLGISLKPQQKTAV